MPPPRPRSARGAAAAYVPLLAGSTWVLVARGTGSEVPWWLLLPAGIWLLVAVVVAAGCAAHAFLGRRWVWGVALLGLWPVAVPLYLWRGLSPT